MCKESYLPAGFLRITTTVVATANTVLPPTTAHPARRFDVSDGNATQIPTLNLSQAQGGRPLSDSAVPHGGKNSPLEEGIGKLNPKLKNPTNRSSLIRAWQPARRRQQCRAIIPGRLFLIPVGHVIRQCRAFFRTLAASGFG